MIKRIRLKVMRELAMASDRAIISVRDNSIAQKDSTILVPGILPKTIKRMSNASMN